MDAEIGGQPVGYEWRSHWCGKSGELVFVNRSERTLTVTAQMKFRTIFPNTARLRITGPVWSDDLEIGTKNPKLDTLERTPVYSVRLVLPPGRHTARFRCTPAVSVLPTDSRNELFTINDFKVIEEPATPDAR